MTIRLLVTAPRGAPIRMACAACTAAALLTACVGAPPVAALAAADPGPVSDAAPRGPYRLRVGDQVRLIVYEEPQFGQEYRVAEDGRVSLPLLGFVDAEGLTVAEFAGAVEAALSGALINEPKVSAEVTGFLPVYVLGEVAAPGAYPYQPDMTLHAVVAAAGGFAPRARRGAVMVRRAGQTTERPVAVEPGAAIEPGDTVRVTSRLF